MADKHIVHKHNRTEGKIPFSSDILEGEIAVNNHAGSEFVSFVNSDRTVVTLDRATEYGKGDNGINYSSVSIKGGQSHSTSKSKGELSSAMGKEIQTQNVGEVGVGKFNETKSNLLFSVGNGNSVVNRSNAFEVLQGGTASVASGLSVGGNVSAQDVEFPHSGGTSTLNTVADKVDQLEIDVIAPIDLGTY